MERLTAGAAEGAGHGYFAIKVIKFKIPLITASKYHRGFVHGVGVVYAAIK